MEIIQILIFYKILMQLKKIYIKRLIKIRENEVKKLAFININQSYHIND